MNTINKPLLTLKAIGKSALALGVILSLTVSQPTWADGDKKPAGNLIGSWATVFAVGGVPIQDVCTFNKDKTYLEMASNQAGKTINVSGSYSYADNQVTINFSNGGQEQATITWDGADRMHYKATKNSDASQIGVDIVYTRQALLSADTIAKDYLDNEVRADTKYKGKILTFVGYVRNDDEAIEKNGEEKDLNLICKVGHTFTGVDGKQDWEASLIACTFHVEDVNQLASINKGDRVTIQGVCEGGIVNSQIDFKDCHIVSKP